MTQIESTFMRDANGVPITNHGLIAKVSRAFTGAAELGAAGATTLFTVTGSVIAAIVGVCTADLTVTGAATIEVGISGNTAALVAQTTASTIDGGELWVDGTPASVVSLPSSKVLTNGTDIIETIATADIDGGALTYYCLWNPLSSDGDVVAA